MSKDYTRQFYIKERRAFNRPCAFTNHSKLELHQVGDKELVKSHVVQPYAEKGAQFSAVMALSTCNTENVEYTSRGMRHVEGGWPKDVSFQDTEQMTRHKKKIERDDIYNRQVMELSRTLEHLVLQNNAINIYDNYFRHLDPFPAVEDCSMKTNNTYKDPTGERRPLSNVSWAPEHQPHMVTCYCRREFLRTQPSNTSAFVWDINNPNSPLQAITASTAPNCIVYNIKDFHLMVGGIFSGQIALWDPNRAGSKPVAYSDRCFSHRDCVNSIHWLSSKTNTELFSGASDGQVLTWDCRKLSEPIEVLFMDPVKTDEQEMGRAFGISVLEFEQTIPSRFMVGTEQGFCFSCNRKGKSPTEKISLRASGVDFLQTQCHFGPVYSLERNPAFVKIYLTVGDWQAKIWSEECKESAIIWTKCYKEKPLAGTWSKTRFSLFFVSREDGVLDGWDLLMDQHDPIMSIKLCDQPLISISAHENGEFVSVGSLDGTMYLVEVSPNMAKQHKNDKSFFSAMLDRETRREKIIESKLRELKLRAKTALEEIAMRQLRQERQRRLEEEKRLEEANKGPDQVDTNLAEEDDPLIRAHKLFFLAIEEEQDRRRTHPLNLNDLKP